MTTAWLDQRERGTASALRLIIWVARVLGRPVARALLYPIAAYFVCLSFAPRRASRQYLSRVFGRKPEWREVFRHYHTFAAVILDRIFLLSGAVDAFEVRIENEGMMADLLARRVGCVLLGAHFGNLEILRTVGLQHPGLEVRLAMFEQNAQMVSRVFAALNPALSEMIIPLGTPEAMLRINDALDRGAFVGMLADRMLGEGKAVSCEFLDARADFPVGPMQLACALNRPVVLGFGVYLGDRRYRIHFEPLVDVWPTDRSLRNAAVEDAVRRYAARLEQHCRDAPYNWFNFYDFWAKSDES